MNVLENLKYELIAARSVEYTAADARAYGESSGLGARGALFKLKAENSKLIASLEEQIRVCKIDELKAKVHKANSVDELKILMLDMLNIM